MELNLDNVENEYLNNCLISAKKEVKKYNNCMPFRDYMHYALYDKKIGYYLSGKYKIGENGDFITSPEVSPLFARCVAQSCKAALQGIEDPSFMEVGAGLGTFAVDFFIELKNLKININKYYILELSSDLRQVQQLYIKNSLPEFYHCFKWVNELPKSGFSGIIFANEVIDAMPVSLFKKSGSQIKSIGVAVDNEKLSFAELASDPELEADIQTIESEVGVFANNYTSEINFWVKPWIQSLYDIIDVGFVLLCDYGYHRKEYYHPDRFMGTLQCYYRHQAHADPLLLPGLQDITAHVDFTRIAEAADTAGFDIDGYTTQGYFLLENGLDELAKIEYGKVGDNNHLKVSRALRKLTMPDAMGEIFKVMALSKQCDEEITGFQKHDLTHLL